ncbi:MAG: flagellar filament capping protein FliD [Gammaproteobacteria bacterium]|nr:flagellar filament capping protein FliD [Gammaproteobacteria bacterium]
MVDNVGSNIGSNIISTLGAGSGINSKSLTDQLVEVERSARQTTIDSRRETFESQISDYGLVRSALATLQDGANLLSNSATFNSKSASFGSSDAFIPTELKETAPVGDYSFSVEAIAKSQSFSSASTYTDPTDSVGKGTLTFSFGEWDGALTSFSQNTEKNPVIITIDDSNNSLNGLRDAINGADMGVQASIVNDGVNGYRLLITAESGLSNQLNISAAEDPGAPGLSNFSFNESSQNLTQQQAGADAHLTVNGLDVYRSSNAIDDVLEGFSFSLAKADPGVAVSVSIFEDKTTAREAVRGFVETFNAFLEAVQPAVGFNEELDDYGSLNRDASAKSVISQIRSMISATVPGIDGGYNALTNVGIRTELDGTISIDEDDFSAAFDDNYDLVKTLFAPLTSSSSDKITVTGFGPTTVPGDYEVEITQQAEKGYLTGSAPAATLLADLAAAPGKSGYYTGGPAASSLIADFTQQSGYLTGNTITAPLDLATQGAGANDYDFNISIDGVASAAAISLNVSDYADYDSMAAALQSAINYDASFNNLHPLLPVSEDILVTFDTDHFVITSPTTGTDSVVSVTDVGGSASTLGLSGGVTTTGTGDANDFDFSITVDGVASGTISLTPGNYADEDAIAAEIQTQINADANLSGAGAAVTVAWDTDRFVVTSQSNGPDSSVTGITAIGLLAPNLGLSSGVATPGSDDTSAYDFTVKVDGVTSGTISLTAAAYADEDALAQHIQNKINADTTLAASGADVDVSWDGSAFVITSREYGAKTGATFTAVGANAADLGLGSGTSTAGKDVVGSIGGEAGFGVGRVLLPSLDSDAYGLKLLVNPGVTSATVSFSRGFGGELSKLIDAYLGKGGVIATREANINQDIDDLDQDQEVLDRRMTAYQERLQAQFLAMERIIAGISGNSSYLDDIANRLPNTAQR